MVYPFRDIEKKWQKKWKADGVYRVTKGKRPKFYVLDMFPYPSGSGLHVGHPLGYIATDIYGRYKRLKGYNVLHPMGFDAFGLPAEQYAIQTGQHPAETTRKNIQRYKEQLEIIGLGYDWSREVWTSDPQFYKWTQWIFLQLFQSWYNQHTDKAEPIETLVKQLEKSGNRAVEATCDADTPEVTAEAWRDMSEKEQQELLLKYRLAYIAYADVNWCPALGTVLANEEVLSDDEHGLVSERGGHPVERKAMRQWFLRITAYADRLLEGLDKLDWPDSIKEMQRHWIGRSEGAMINFEIEGASEKVAAFTTRPDTIFGATYMVLAPEHKLVEHITTPEQRKEVEQYMQFTYARTERERQADVKQVTGAFTGAYVLHPLTGDKLPVWIADYVLAGYGTGAIMAVPAHDTRDHKFAKKFELPIPQVIQPRSGEHDVSEASYDGQEGTLVNSGPLNGLEVAEAIQKAIELLESKGAGRRQVNYKLRDFLFSRQRYWGEPFPIVFRDSIPYPVDEAELPVELPEMESFKPSPDGEPPLTRKKEWVGLPDGSRRETNTMPGWAGSNWYFLRYMDPKNNKELVSKSAEEYWGNVDLYVGGAEHATSHLIYARFWNKFLYDIGKVQHEDPFQKLVNQGMIQGVSKFAYRLIKTNTFVSYGVFTNLLQYPQIENELKGNVLNIDYDSLWKDNLYDKKDKTTSDLHGKLVYQKVQVWTELVDKNDILDIEKFKKWRPQYKDAKFIEQKRGFVCDSEVEKMSKSKYNVVNPDDVIAKYGADTFRIYEMFLGPIEQHKPWDTEGIDGAHRFLNKFWRLFFDEKDNFRVSDAQPSEEALRVLHKTIRKVSEDIEKLAFNTAISAMMVGVNELSKLKCHKRAVLYPFTVVLAPFAPHMAEELWQRLGEKGSVVDAAFPDWEEKYVQEDMIEYPVAVNGKTRTKLKLPAGMARAEIEKTVLAEKALEKWLGGKSPKKVIVVPEKIVNIVV